MLYNTLCAVRCALYACAVRCIRLHHAVECCIMRGGEALICTLCCESYCSPTARSFELFLPDGTLVRSKTDTSHSVGHEFLSAPISCTAIKTYNRH